jgi:Co/Zn/Cd efflux system component
MNVIRLVVNELVKELVGMFVDDGNLALLAVVLIALITAAVKLLALPPLAGGCLLLVGCLAILVESARRAARGAQR